MAQVVRALPVDAHLRVYFQLELIYVIGKYLACFLHAELYIVVSISKQPEQRLRDGDLSLPLCFLEVCAEKGRNFYLQSSWQHLRSCPKLRNDARQETPQSSCAKDMARRATAGLHEKSLG